MPKYAALIYTPAETEGQGTPEQWQQIMAEYQTFGENAGAAGVIAGGEALEPTSTATTVQVSGGAGGDVMTTDGPYAEAKEVLGGFYLIDVANLDAAIEWAAKIPAAPYGSVEVRPIMEIPEE